MTIRTYIDQLQQLLERWIKLHQMLKAVLDLGFDCARATEDTGLSDVIDMTARFSNNLDDLYDMYRCVEEMCDCLQQAISMLQDAEDPAAELLSPEAGMRKCPVCGFRQSASHPYCFNCGRMMDAASAAKPASSDNWDDDPWGDDITLSDSRGISFSIDSSMSSSIGSGEFDAAPPPDTACDAWDDSPAPSSSVSKVRITRDSMLDRITELLSDNDSVEDAGKVKPPEKHKSRTRSTHSMPPLAHMSNFSRVLEQADFSEGQRSSETRVCPTCGSIVPVHMDFCRFCGAQLPAESPAPPRISDVQFSAVAPRRFERGARTMVDIFMYEDGWRHIIDRHIRAMEQDAQETGSGYRRVAEGAQIRIVLTSPDVNIPDGERSAPWSGKYLQFTFAVRVPKELRAKDFLLQAAVFVDDVPLTRLTWTMRRDTASHKIGLWAKKRREVQTPETVRADINSAFISYSSADLDRVSTIVQGIRAVRPDLDIFFDVDSLHSGEQWKRTLEKEIIRRDVLFLCWSPSAKQSEWVSYEWKFALERKGIGAIQPVPLELPSVCPPPPELSELHFNDKLLYFNRIIKANT